MQNGSRAPIQQKHFSWLQWSRWWPSVSETIWTSASFAHRSFSFVSCVCLSWSCVWQAVWKCDAGFIIRYTGNTLTHITCTVSVTAFLNPNSSLQAIRYASGYFNWQVKHFFYFNLCWHIEGLYSTFHSNFLLQQISQSSLELTLEPTRWLPDRDFTSFWIFELLLTYFRFRVTFCLRLSEKDTLTLPMSSSGLSWPSRYRHCSLYAIFPTRQEGISICSRLKKEGRVERVQLLFTCNSSQSNPLPPPRGLGKLRRFREIRGLTKQKKDIIPFVLVELIPCEVEVLLLPPLLDSCLREIKSHLLTAAL